MSTKINKFCKNCGDIFKVYQSEIKKKRGFFCSRECYDQFRRNPQTCLNCGEVFHAPRYSVKGGNGKYCSKRCFDEYREKNITIRTCEYCGKQFKTYPSKTKRFCNSTCAGNALSGENSPAWKGGISYEPYCSLFNNEFKERVREFWGRKCGVCGKPEEENNRKLSVHHVTYDKKVCCNTTKPLFVPLCSTHHSMTNENRKYWEEMLTNYIMIWFDGKCFKEMI